MELGDVALDAYFDPATLPVCLAAAVVLLLSAAAAVAGAVGAATVEVLLGLTGVGSAGAGVGWERVEDLRAVGTGAVAAAAVVTAAGVGVVEAIVGAGAGVGVAAAVVTAVVVEPWAASLALFSFLILSMSSSLLAPEGLLGG